MIKLCAALLLFFAFLYNTSSWTDDTWTSLRRTSRLFFFFFLLRQRVFRGTIQRHGDQGLGQLHIIRVEPHQEVEMGEMMLLDYDRLGHHACYGKWDGIGYWR